MTKRKAARCINTCVLFRKEGGKDTIPTILGAVLTVRATYLSVRHHCIVTLVERKTGFVIIKKITARTAEQVTAACIKAIKEHRRMFKTITFDNGTEFHSYKEIEAKTSVKCYFAASYHSWERGTNENTKGLIRQYLPKRSCMREITQADCDRIAYLLNTRPRKRQCYKTPENLYYGKDSALHLLLEARQILYLNLVFRSMI